MDTTTNLTCDIFACYQWGKNGLFKKWCWSSCLSIWEKMQLYVYLSLLSSGELKILKVKGQLLVWDFLKEIRGKYRYDEEGFIKHEMKKPKTQRKNTEIYYIKIKKVCSWNYSIKKVKRQIMNLGKIFF